MTQLAHTAALLLTAAEKDGWSASKGSLYQFSKGKPYENTAIWLKNAISELPMDNADDLHVSSEMVSIDDLRQWWLSTISIHDLEIHFHASYNQLYKLAYKNHFGKRPKKLWKRLSEVTA